MYFASPECSERPSREAGASEMPRRDSQYVEALSDERTKLEDISTIWLKGATGIDGDTKVSGACRALGVS
jgi:hypothetical protein